MSDIVWAIIAIGLGIVLYSAWPIIIFGVLYAVACMRG